MLGPARQTAGKEQGGRTVGPRDHRPKLRVHTGDLSAQVAQLVDTLLTKIQDHSAIVGMVGLGYVGLPFAVEKAKVGYHVIGIEQNQERADRVNAGENYIPDVKDDELRDLVQKGCLEAVTDLARVAEMDVIVIAVPTPLTKNLIPDLQYVEHVTRELAGHVRPGQLISLESTTYPGTTDEVMLPELEMSGLKVEQDLFLTHSPERVDPGNKRYTTKNTTKVVGGVGRRFMHKPSSAWFRSAAPRRRSWLRCLRTPSGPSTSHS